MARSSVDVASGSAERHLFGVRSSAGAVAGRYGTHTPCVVLEVPGDDPIVLDLGTGLAAWAGTLDGGGPLRAQALLTRAHADHVGGLGLVDGLAVEGSRLEVYGPSPGAGLVGGSHPSTAGEIRFETVDDEDLAIGDAKVAVRPVPHPDPVNGYRVDWEGVSVSYLAVHQAPSRLDTVCQGALELADGVDLLIHDAALTTAEWSSPSTAGRSTAGRSTVDYAVLVAREAGARRLALFGHCPERGDDELDRILAGARRTAERLGIDEVLAAAEGTTVSFERSTLSGPGDRSSARPPGRPRAAP